MALFFGSLSTALTGAAPAEYDLAVYDASSGGVTAAVSAARNGLSTVLLCASWPACYPEGGHRIGGMASSGLGQTDVGGSCPIEPCADDTRPYTGGLAREFYERNRRHYDTVVNDTTCRLPLPDAGMRELTLADLN